MKKTRQRIKFRRGRCAYCWLPTSRPLSNDMRGLLSCSPACDGAVGMLEAGVHPARVSFAWNAALDARAAARKAALRVA